MRVTEGARGGVEAWKKRARELEDTVAWADAVFGAVLQYPGTHGAVRDLRAPIAALKAAGAISVVTKPKLGIKQFLHESAQALTDAVRAKLEATLGAADRARLDEYFTAVRQVEQRLALQLEKPPPAAACRVPASCRASRRCAATWRSWCLSRWPGPTWRRPSARPPARCCAT